MNQHELERARAALPKLATCTYLNTGTFGVLAKPVLDSLLALTTQAEETGSPGFFEVGKQVKTARRRLAHFLGCHSDELAFTENATHGLNLAAFGFPLGPDDVVLMSNEEYFIAEHIYRYQEQHNGPRVRFFAISHDPQETLTNVEAAWCPKVRSVLVSAVTCETAVRLPVEKICALARENNAWSIVDVAQSTGQFHFDLHAIGCDMAVGGGHKWLHGPKGVGFFYARREVIPQMSPPWVSHYATRDPETQKVTLPVNHTRFELVARTQAPFAALSAAFDWLESFGWESQWKHMAEMREIMCREIEKRPRLRLLSPRHQAESSSMVTFLTPGIDQRNVSEFTTRAWDTARIYLRPSPSTGGIRLSAAYFTLEEEIARFFSYLDQETGAA